jgi:hypothetical protein
MTDVEGFLSSADDAPITLWSMQQPGALEILRKTGRLAGNPVFAFAPDCAGKVPAGKKGAYTWMQQQMAKRVRHYQQELPIWALFSRPEHTNRRNDKLLRIEVPKSRMLVSFYHPWEKLLGIMNRLEANNWVWPDIWPAPLCPYLFVDEEDEEAQGFDSIGGRPRGERARRYHWDEGRCRASWERMFDLRLARRERFLWTPIYLQAMLPNVFLTDVKEELPISLEGS